MLFFHLANVSDVCRQPYQPINLSCVQIVEDIDSKFYKLNDSNEEWLKYTTKEETFKLDVTSSCISIINVVLNVSCLLVFYIIWKENKRATIHVALLYLSLCEMLYQAVTAVRHVSTALNWRLDSSALVLELEQFRSLLELTLYASRNWWLAVIACCRAYFVSGLPSRDVHFQCTLVSAARLFFIVVAVSASYVFGMFLLLVRPPAAACPVELWHSSEQQFMMTAMTKALEPQVSWRVGQLGASLPLQLNSVCFAALFILMPFCTITVSSALIWRSIIKNAYGGSRRYFRVAVIIGAITAAFFFSGRTGLFLGLCHASHTSVGVTLFKFKIYKGRYICRFCGYL